MQLYKLVTTLAFLIGMGITAQTSQLVGDWEFDYQSAYNELSVDEQSQIDNMSAEMIDILKSRYNEKKIVFNANETYIQTLESGAIEEGNWRYEPIAKVLSLTDNSGNTLKYEITLLSESALYFKPFVTGFAGNVPPSALWCYKK